MFITHEDNPAHNITKEQVQEIYSSMTIDNWFQLGGVNGRIVPICRNADAGSQAQIENIVGTTVGELFIKPLWFEGIEPTSETIGTEEYPLATNYYAVIRKDTEADHSARRIAEWLISDEGQWHVMASGLGGLKPLVEQ